MLLVENTYVGPFLIVKKLGTNRRQRVYRARQTEQNRDVALKFISVPPDMEWNSVLGKIEAEAAELQKLKHPNLVKLYGAGVHEDQIFFASELVDGESLASLLARRGRISFDLVVEYCRQVADVLHYLHSRDLIHSKLTPEKILVTPQHQIKVADLRLNRTKRRRWDTSRLRELDIAAYLAPEQFSEGATEKSDLYSLGVIVYELLTGKLPYDLDNIGRMVKLKASAEPPSVAAEVIGCPIWLDKLVAQMLQPDPRKRPHSAKAISLACEEIKKMDASQESTAAHVVGSFNALNAGVDKSEARRLLSKKKKKSAETPVFQTVPFLAGSLVLIVAFLALMFWLVNSSETIDRYEAMVASDDPEQWTEARIKLKTVQDRTRDEELARRAASLSDLARRKLLVHRAEAGLTNRLQSDNIQAFSKAIGLEKDQKPFEALAVYQQLIRAIPSNHDELYIAQASRERIEKLHQQVAIPDTRDELTGLITSLAQADSVESLKFKNEVLAKTIVKLAGDPEMEDLHQQATLILDENRIRLKEWESQAPPEEQNSD